MGRVHPRAGPHRGKWTGLSSPVCHAGSITLTLTGFGEDETWRSCSIGWAIRLATRLGRDRRLGGGHRDRGSRIRTRVPRVDDELRHPGHRIGRRHGRAREEAPGLRRRIGHRRVPDDRWIRFTDGPDRADQRPGRRRHQLAGRRERHRPVPGRAAAGRRGEAGRGRPRTDRSRVGSNWTPAQAQLDAASPQLPPDQVAAQQAKLDAGKAALEEKSTQLELGAQLLQLSDGIRVVSEDGSTALVNVQFTKTRLELPEASKQAVVDHFTRRDRTASRCRSRPRSRRACRS